MAPRAILQFLWPAGLSVMGKVRVRPETGKLFLDFRYMQTRFREQTLLDDTSHNRKRLSQLLQKIEAKILLGEFDYAEFFPNSPNLSKLPDTGANYDAKPLPAKQLPTPKVAVLPTLGDFADLWFKERSIEWRTSHSRNVRSTLDSAILPALGPIRLDQLTKANIMEFRTQQACKPGRSGNATLSPKALNNRMGILKMILEEAAERFEFDTPYRNIKPLRLRKTHIEPFSLSEVNKILETVREDYRDYYAVRFFTGMRTGEIDGLRWEFVDFSRRQILVRETLVGGKTEYTKTDGSQREIPMLGPVFDALKSQYEATHKLSRYVFCNSVGEPLDSNNVTKRVWYPLLRHLGLKKRRPYQTRHTAATLLLASGENPEWVARLLGHSSTEMLFKVYSRYIPNLTRMDGSAFENLVGNSNVA